MSVTISFSLQNGVVLPRDLGETLATRAAALVDALGRESDWTYLGRVDTRGMPRVSAWSPPSIYGHRWRVSGGARFTLALIAGTGQLAEATVRTSAAGDPVAAHRSVLAVLGRLNRDIYGGRIAVVDDTEYATTGDENALLQRFADDARLVDRVARSLTDTGWEVAPEERGDPLGVPLAVLSFDVFDARATQPDDVLNAELVEDVALPEDGEAAGDERASWRPRRPTLLETFLKSRGVKPAHLARESGYSRQFILRIRMGQIIPSLACMTRIVAALRRLSRERLTAPHVFEPEIVERLRLAGLDGGMPPRTDGDDE